MAAHSTGADAPVIEAVQGTRADRNDPSITWRSKFDENQIVLGGYRARSGTGHTDPTRRGPAKRSAIRLFLSQAEENVDAMLTLCAASSLVELANKGFELRQNLRDLWNLRDVREVEWGDLINVVEGAIVSTDFEEYTVEHCE